MEVILLERVEGLGQMGDEVSVKPGYARNFLLPKGKALRATGENKAHFEGKRIQLEADNLNRRKEAESVGSKLDRQSFVLVRQAGDTGQLYGSVTVKDIASKLLDSGFKVDKNQVRLNEPIKAIGVYEVIIVLHPEVTVNVNVNVARSVDEAENQENVVGTKNISGSNEENLTAGQVFEDGVTPATILTDETSIDTNIDDSSEPKSEDSETHKP